MEKQKNIYELMQETSRTLSGGEWPEFLRSAAWNFRFKFLSQSLIYAQRPDATACYSFNEWHNRFERRIRRGAKGIALLDDSKDQMSISYVFDYKDTYSPEKKHLETWKLTPEKEPAVREVLMREFMPDEPGVDLDMDAFSFYGSAVSMLLDDKIADTLPELLAARGSSRLSEVSDEQAEDIYRILLLNSVTAMVMHRCGFDPGISSEDFADAAYFNTDETMSILGNATQSMGIEILRVIAKTIAAWDIEHQHKEEKNHENEPDVSADRGVSDPEPDRSHEPRSEQIQPSAQEIPEREQGEPVHRPFDERSADGASDADEPDSAEAGGGDDGAAYEEESSSGESEGEPAVDPAHGDAEASGRGNGISGDDLRLKYFTEQYMTAVLLAGPNTEGGKYRLQKAAEEMSPEAFDRILREEYDFGERRFVFEDGEEAQVKWDSQGIGFYGEDFNPAFLIWSSVQTRIRDLVDAGRYLDEQEKIQSQRYFADQESLHQRQEMGETLRVFHSIHGPRDQGSIHHTEEAIRAFVYENSKTARLSLLADFGALSALPEVQGDQIALKTLTDLLTALGDDSRTEFKSQIPSATDLGIINPFPTEEEMNSLAQQQKQPLAREPLDDIPDFKVDADDMEASEVPFDLIFGEGEVITLSGMEYLVLEVSEDTVTIQDIEHPLFTQELPLEALRTLVSSSRPEVPQDETLYRESEPEKEADSSAVKGISITEKSSSKDSDASVSILRIDIVQNLRHDYDALMRTSGDAGLPDADEFAVILDDFFAQTNQFAGRSLTAKQEQELRTADYNLKAMAAVAYKMKDSQIDGIRNTGETVIQQFCTLCQVEEPALYELAKSSDWISLAPSEPMPVPVPEPVSKVVPEEKEEHSKPIRKGEAAARKNYKQMESLAPYIMDGTLDHVHMESEGFEPLYVERIADDQIAIAHTFEQNGDLVVDPEIVFWEDKDAKALYPISIEQPIFGGLYQPVYDPSDKDYLYPNASLARDITSFFRTWRQNLEWQGHEPVYGTKHTPEATLEYNFKDGALVLKEPEVEEPAAPREDQTVLRELLGHFNRWKDSRDVQIQGTYFDDIADRIGRIEVSGSEEENRQNILYAAYTIRNFFPLPDNLPERARETSRILGLAEDYLDLASNLKDMGNILRLQEWKAGGEQDLFMDLCYLCSQYVRGDLPEDIQSLVDAGTTVNLEGIDFQILGFDREQLPGEETLVNLKRLSDTPGLDEYAVEPFGYVRGGLTEQPDYYEAIPALANFLNLHDVPGDYPEEMHHSFGQLVLAGLNYENDRYALHPERRQAEREQERAEAQKPQRTVGDVYREFQPVVLTRVMADEAFVNALYNADEENLKIEGDAAIKRAVLAVNNMELTKFYFDMTQFHNRLHRDVMTQALDLKQWRSGDEQQLLHDMLGHVQDLYDPRPNLFDLGYTNNQQDTAEQIEAVYQFLTKTPPEAPNAAYYSTIRNVEQYREERPALYPGRDFSRSYPDALPDHPELITDRHFPSGRADKETLADLLEFIGEYRTTFKDNTPALSEHDQAAYDEVSAFMANMVVTDDIQGNLDNINNALNYINAWFVPFTVGMNPEFLDAMEDMLSKARALDPESIIAEAREGAYRLDDGTYLYIQTSDEGYDYTLYDRNLRDMDGGQLDEPELSLLDARDEILSLHDLHPSRIEEIPVDEFEQMQYDAEMFPAQPETVGSTSKNASLYDESSFHEGDFYEDANGRGIITRISIPEEGVPHEKLFSIVDPDAPEDSRDAKGYIVSMDAAIRLLNRGEATLSHGYERPEPAQKQKEQEPTLFDFEFEPVDELPKEEKPVPVPVQAAQGAASQQERINFRMPEDTVPLGGPKARYQNNVAAIRLLKDLESEDRLATPAEQAVLSKYVGWGGLQEAFDPSAKSWSAEYKELKDLLTEDEYSAARESTLTAFYTPPEVTSAVYRVLENLGFQRGNILDPGCGTGSFSGRLPEEMSESKVYGIEKDSLSGRIARQLYQKNNIAIEGYENTKLPDNFFDVAVGNVPFGNFKVPDKQYDKLNLPIHDYFFAKTLDKVRPGGVIAFVTSMGTMDKQSTEFRRYLSQRADLLGAIRLPNNTFKTNAGTDVTSDIIFLQKREFPRVDEADWVNLDRGVVWNEDAKGNRYWDYGPEVNSYFASHPEMILGQMKEISGPHGPELACIAREGETLKAELARAVQNITGSIKEAEQGLYDQEYEERKSIPADPDVRNFSYTLVGDDIYFREDSEMFKVETGKKGEERIRGLIGLRDIVHELIDAQVEGYSDETIRALQRRLNDAYDTFTAKNGLINSRGNDMAFSDDSSYYLLCSLEHINDEGEFLGKADIFYKRTIHALEKVDHVDSPQEALAVSLGEYGRIDFDFMSRLSGLSQEELVRGLQGQIFEDPSRPGTFEIAALYLSGNVREKLAQARAAEKEEPGKWGANIQALEDVQPKDLEPADITARLGSTWIPQEDYTKFMYELLDPSYWIKRDESIKAIYNPYANLWTVTNNDWDRTNAKANTTYGTRRMNAYEIIERTLNLKEIKIFDTVTAEDGTQRRVLNENDTMEAQEKQQMIMAAFKEWLWKDPGRTERLCKSYNERFNSYVPPKFDGSMVRYHNINPNVSMRPWQSNAVARIMYNGNTLLAHAVGAGKTWTMSAAAMEMKHLGLCSKSLIVVPNHLVGQWASAIYDQYPNAKVLASTKKDFETKNRKKFCSRIATGDYDVIVIGHSQFERIPLSKERQEAGIQEEIDKIMDGISALKAENAEHFTIKQMERMKKSLEARLEKLNNSKRRDSVITFEQLGVDRLFVDESHEFKNLFHYTKMQNVAGISQTDSQKASDMYLKCQYINELTGYKGVIHATGTPLSNTMAELYATQRYLQKDLLERMDLDTFDQWASTFGETVTSVELAPEGTGYRARTRFANFFNIPELMSLYNQVADIQTADMLDLPLPTPHYETVAVPASDIQKEYVRSLGDRAQKIRNGGVKPEEDNMLCITNDGRKLALDQRLIDPDWPDNPNSKVNACADNIHRIWTDSMETKGTQLVFCDISTPTSKGFNVYDDLKQKLIARGIPAEEIRFVHEANTDAQKEALFQKVRDGEVRVLMGSTGKMGTGTNVQNRLVAGHDLDCPWRPSDLEQRAGRVIRQGNTNDDVYMYRYVTEGTFDAYLYQLVENKQRFISQIYTSKPIARQAADVDEIVMSFAEIKALASGNPLIKERVEVEGDVQRLQMLKARHENGQLRLKQKVTKEIPEKITLEQMKIAKLEKDMALVSSQPSRTKDDRLLPITVKGVTYEHSKEAGEAILTALKRAPKDDVTEIGSMRGFTLSVNTANTSWGKPEPVLQLAGPGSTYSVTPSESETGTVIRLNNVLDKEIPEDLKWHKNVLSNLRRELQSAKKELGQPFAREAELSAKEQRLAELTRQLDLDAQESPVNTPAVEPPVKEPAEPVPTGKPSLDSLIHSAGVRQAAQAHTQMNHNSRDQYHR